MESQQEIGNEDFDIATTRTVRVSISFDNLKIDEGKAAAYMQRTKLMLEDPDFLLL